MTRFKAFLLVSAVAVASLSSAANAAVIGVFGNSQTQANAAAVAAGHTAVNLADLTAPSLTGLDVLWVLNGNNSAQIPDLGGNAAAIDAFVNAGGKLLVHDRWSGQTPPPNPSIPGGAGITLQGSFTADVNIPATSPYFGILTDTTLDGGNWSAHGFATVIPVGATVLITSPTGEAVDFSYTVGTGLVYYSTIPLDFYLAGVGTNGDAFRNVYTPLVLRQVAGEGTPVPEPASLALLGAGLAGLAAARRRKAA